MGIANIGIPGLILILIIALIIFGPNKLPELGKAAGSTIKEFKNATTELVNGNDDEDYDEDYDDEDEDEIVEVKDEEK